MDSVSIGIVISIFGVLFFFTNTFVTPLLKRVISDRDIVVYGLSADTITITVYAALTNGWQVIPLFFFRSLSSIDDATIQGLISKQYPQEIQGSIQGVVNSVRLSTYFLAPLALGNLWAYFISPTAIYYIPQIVFYICGFVYLIALLIAVSLFSVTKEVKHYTKLEIPKVVDETQPMINATNIINSEEEEEEEVYIKSLIV